MKSIGKILLFAFFVFSMFMLKPRQDVVFEAIDMSQYIRLFEEDRDFVLCLDENRTFTGTYAIQADTVYLSYGESVKSALLPQVSPEAASHKALPARLFIDESASTIASNDGQLFSAEILLDLREKPYEATAHSPIELRNNRASILAFGGLKKSGDLVEAPLP